MSSDPASGWVAPVIFRFVLASCHVFYHRMQETQPTIVAAAC
ncbi:hypothetical protein [Hymenobacter jejuensis]|nr:hypothetical protein [Hymenobacter jejuensis]